jgi:hypothetical protein
MKRLVLAALIASAGPSAAEPLGAEAFEAYVTGQTIRYRWFGQFWGEEQYLPGRKVIWRANGGTCESGTWFEAGPGEICFLYGEDSGPVCWLFNRIETGLSAQPLGASEGEPLLESGQSPVPISCAGPEVGV